MKYSVLEWSWRGELARSYCWLATRIMLGLLSLFTLSLLVYSIVHTALHHEDIVPQQVHLAYHGVPSKMVISWVTFRENSRSSFVRFGIDATKMRGVEREVKVEAVTTGAVTRFFHTATLRGLLEGERYYYSIGLAADPATRLRSFKTFSDSDDPFTFAIYGDLGVENGVSIPHLNRAALDDKIHMSILVGDLAYDLHSDSGRVGDRFMNMLEPLASRIPFMVCSGNHELASNFKQIRTRFAMPSNGVSIDQQFYSFDVSSVHFVALSSELYALNGMFAATRRELQLEWLRTDLQQDRATSWTIVYLHRPLYCSTLRSKGCSLPLTKKLRNDFEPIFLRHNVSLVFSGHEHYYERSAPLDNGQITDYGNNTDVYVDPQSPVYIISGKAGCHSRTEQFLPRRPEWSIARSVRYGYTRVRVSPQELLVQQLDVERNSLVDEFRILRSPLF